MNGYREIYIETQNIIGNNPNLTKESSLWDLMKESYVNLMVSFVGRQLDRDNRSASLINLLNFVRSNCDLYTVEWYASH